MAKQASPVVRDLIAVGAIGTGMKVHKLPKSEQLAVLTPRGETAVAKDFASRYGARRVILIYGDGYHSERGSDGTKRATSAEGRYLLGQAKKG